MGGEHTLLLLGCGWLPESSPRGRGTRIRRHGHRIVPGIIPAWAGNTARSPTSTSSTWDHPRVGEEHPLMILSPPRSMGSSPRGRGTLDLMRQTRDAIGIIPAWAGNTAGGDHARERARDHPRVGGEHATFTDGLLPVKGSSPRGRGTRGLSRGSPPGDGIIPAWAGNTHPPATPSPRPRDHPRVGGEHSITGVTTLMIVGSSPRGRGTRHPRSRRRRRSGIIPAWAGNTTSKPARARRSRDHPRVGGEHTWKTLQSQ